MTVTIKLDKIHLTANWVGVMLVDDKIIKIDGQDNISPKSGMYNARPSVGDSFGQYDIDWNWQQGIVVYTTAYHPNSVTTLKWDTMDKVITVTEEKYLGEIDMQEGMFFLMAFGPEGK